MNKLLIISLLFLVVTADYFQDREQFIEDELDMHMGARIILNEKEEAANKILMNYKNQEMDEGFKNLSTYPPAMHFFKAIPLIEKSTVFSILKQMPKGAALHLHDTAMLKPDWIVKNLTYRDHLYTKLEGDYWTFVYADPPPGGQWQSVKDMRAKARSVEEYDKWLESLFTLIVPNPEVKYPDVNIAWEAFMKIFFSITPLLTYRPVLEDYMYEVLDMFRRDNVFYIEMRGTLPPCYELNGTVIDDNIELITIMYNVNKRFVKDHPDCLGMKYIYGNLRNVPSTVVEEYIKTYRQMKCMYPNYIAGFDLVGQEDTGTPLVNFTKELVEAKDELKYFFHAGETNWSGMTTDINLIDAVLLNSLRIGHGYAIIKHPKVMEEVKKRKIAIEICPISNQVLKLVEDYRNHPANVLITQDFPVVISCDDPGFWGATGLSYDFYIAFMGMASKAADLKMLKQLVLNSIEYSAMSNSEKTEALRIWKADWNFFINNVIKQYKNLPNPANNCVSQHRCAADK